MKDLLKKVLGLVIAVSAFFGVTGFAGQPVLAAECDEGQVSTSILGGGCVDVDEKGDVIMDYVRLVVRILVYGLGAAATIGVVIAGILYLTARDNEQQVVVAKRRLFEIMVGLAVWAVMAIIMEWLIPGGLGDSLKGM